MIFKEENFMKQNQYISKKGIIIIAVLLAVLVIFAVIFYSTRRTGNMVIISHNGKVTGRYALSDDREIRIKDTGGKVTNVVCIRNGQVYMKEADCPDQICVHQGRKSKDGESITCLPNKVVVEVRGADRSGMDTMTN